MWLFRHGCGSCRCWFPGQAEFDGAGGEHDQGEGGAGGVEPERASHDEAYPLVEALEAGVGQTEADRGEDPLAVFADGAPGLDERLEAGALHAGAPAVEEFSCGRVRCADPSPAPTSAGL